RRFACCERAGRQLEQVLADCLAPLPDERELPVVVDGDNRDGAWMLDDLALVLAPALGRDVEQLAVVHRAGRVGLHAANRSTSRRCSASNHGGSPAAAVEPARPALRVPGMTTSTRPSQPA